MTGWFETAAVVLIAASGIFAGRAISRLRYPLWIWGFIVPFVFIVILATIRLNHSLIFMPPFAWIMAGRLRFVVMALAVTISLSILGLRFSQKTARFATFIIMIAVVGWCSVLPFLAPVLMKGQLLELPTIIDSDGICMQTTDFTCAPAAAVTALAKFGLQADEGQLAVLSHTNPMAGTLPVCLSDAIKGLYGQKGLDCQYRRFDSIEQLKGAPVTLAVVKSSLFGDHCITILEVHDHQVSFADPALGKVSMSYEDFEKIWRFAGIVLKMNPQRRI